MKEDLISKLVSTFKEEAEKYSNTVEGVVNYKVEEFFKKNNPEKGYHSVDALVIFKNFTLKLEYKVDISMLLPKSTVEMRFMFENGKLPVEYSIYDVLSMIDDTNFKCYTFTYVTTVEKMKEVLKYLVDTFREYKESIDKLSRDVEKIAILEKDITEKIDLLVDEKVFEAKNPFYMMHMLELYYVIDISRFTLNCYMEYLNGKNKKAISGYNKISKKLTAYEKRLVEYMKKGDINAPIEDGLNTYMQAKKLKTSKKEILLMVISWVFLTPIWYIVYSLIFALAYYLLTQEAIYVGGVEPFVLFMPAFVTAIINSFFIRKIVYKIFFRKNYNNIIALDEIENGGRTTNLMMKLFQFVIATGIVISMLTANTNIAFYENRFKNNLDFFSIKGENVSYKDVESVYKVEGMKNTFGQVIQSPTYVIVLNNGKQINLYYHMEFVTIQQNVIPIFENRGINVKEIDLVENISINEQK